MFERFKKREAPIEPRDTLFGDRPLHYWAGIDCNEEPWTLFKEAKKNVDQSRYNEAIGVLKDISSRPGFESRHYLQACYFLNKLSSAPEFDIRIYGVVVEVGMLKGNDMVAIYADHTARYFNYTGKSIFWDQSDMIIDSKIDEILLAGKEVLSKIGLWKDLRPPAPSNGLARINFLTSHGLYFGEGSQANLFNNPLVGKMMHSMLYIMETLIDRTLSSTAKK